MVKKLDPTLQMDIHQYLVTGRRLPTKTEANPEVFAMRLFAKNEVLARSKFWYQTKRQNKLKRANGEILAVNEIFEKSARTVKTYGVAIKYQSRKGMHNMYKEYRDVTLNGAISQLYMEMSSRHRALHDTIHILRASAIGKTEDIRRPRSIAFRKATLRFPILKNLPRASAKKYRTTFKAHRPTTAQYRSRLTRKATA
jgi:large subunit ribosomal protein L18Ae